MVKIVTVRGCEACARYKGRKWLKSRCYILQSIVPKLADHSVKVQSKPDLLLMATYFNCTEIHC